MGLKFKTFYFIIIFYVFPIFTLSWAQTTLISPTGDGGFETGTSFAANGWSVVNAATNTWQVGTAATAYAGSRGAYISNNSGTSWAYSTGTSQTSHFYRDVTVPAGETNIQLSFYWKGRGESGYDRLLVYTAPTTVTPVAGIPASISTTLTGATLVYTQASYSQTTYTQANITLSSSLAGTTIRLIFTWQNDISGGVSPGAAIDNISLISYPAMSGIYTIDKNLAESATNFNSFNSAIQAINTRGISSSVIFNVNAGQTFNENLPALTATGTASNTITFQKSGVGINPKIVPTGAGSTDFGICISGGDYITFDGIDVDGSAATTTTNAIEFGYLIRNASATNGAQYNTIKNCSVTLNKNYISAATNACILISASTTVGGGVAATNATGANSYNKYYNLTLSNAQNGIYAVGTSTTYPDLLCEFGVAGSGCQTSRNTISNIGGVLGSSSAYGIYTSYLSGAKIFNFDVSNVRSTLSSSSFVNTSGISLKFFTGINEIYNNKVSDISTTSTSSTAIVTGIDIQSGTSSQFKIYNNFIYDIKSAFTGGATTSIYAYGIYSDASSGNTLEIDNNNVYLTASGSPTYSSACFGLSNANALCKVRGNIFFNAFPNQTTANHVAWYSSSTTSIGATGSISNYNDLYVTGTNGFIGRGLTTTYANLTNWQARTGTPDANSISIDPTYTSSTDLHVSATGLFGISGFTPQSWVTTDIDCDPQDSTYWIGADASAGSGCTTPSDQASALQLTSVTSSSLQGSFTVAASSPSGYLVVRSTSNNLSSNPVNTTSYAAGNPLGGGVVVQSSASTTFSQSSLTDNTIYYYFIFSYNNSGCSGGPLYNVTTPLTGSTATCLATPSTPTFSGITSSEMTVNWGAVTGATSYSLEVSTNSSFTAPISGSPFSVAGTSEELTGLTSGNTYYVRVTALGGNCNSAASASANTTLTCATPSAQGTLLNFSAATTTSISGSFTAATVSPSGYIVVRSTSNFLSANPIDGTSYSSGGSIGGGIVVGTPGSSTSISATGLTSGTQYYFFVFSYNNTSCSGGPVYNITSPLIGTATTCLSGTPSTPNLSNETTTSIQASWSDFNGATSYRLDVSTNSSFSSFVTGYQDLVVSGTSQSITGLNPNTLYYVRVRAHNESCPSSNSNTASRTTLKIEPSNQPTNFAASSASTNSISLSWTAAIAGSQLPDGYLIKGSATSLSAISDPVDGTDPGTGSLALSSGVASYKTSSSSGTFTGHTAGTMYFYKIYSYTNASTGIDFKTDNVPNLYQATQPNNSGTPVFTATSLNAGQATISWAQPSGFDSAKHKILVFVKSGSTAISTTALNTNPTFFTANTVFGSGTAHSSDSSAYCVYNGDGTSVTISGLTGNTTYQVRILVGMLDANSNSTYTYSSGVTTSGTTLKIEPTNQPTNFTAGTATTTNIPLSWTAAVAGSQLPDGYLIKGSATSLSAISDPVDGTDPGTGSLALSSGVASYKTSSSSGTFTGHTAGTMYFYKIYSYTNASTGIDFKTNNVPNLYQATQPNNSGTPVFTATSLNAGQATISWAQPSGFDAAKHKILVFVKSGSTAISTTALNTNPTTFTANTVFGSGTAHSSDVVAYCVYNGDGTSVTISGLTGNTTYQVRILVGMLDANSNSTYTYSSGVTTSGTTLKIEPTNQPTNFTAGTVTTSNIPLSWTAAVGSQLPDGYLIKGSATSLEAISDPVDGIDSTNDTSFNDGIAMVKTTTNPYSSFANQTAGTMYYYKIYSYTNTTTSSTTSTTIDYKTDNVPTLYHATLPAVNTAPVFSATTSNATTISWSQPVSYSNSNHSTLVFVKAGSAVTFGTPTSNPVNYSANTSFGLGTTYQNDALAYCVYKGDLTNITVQGLNGSTNYHILIVTVVDDSNSNGTNSYSTSLTANKTTLCNTVDLFNLDFEGISNLPQCTYFLSTDANGASNINLNPYQGTRCLLLQSSTTYILPPVNNSHLNSHYISFYARTTVASSGQIGFGYLTDPSDATTYVNLHTFNLTTNYQICSYIPSNIPQNTFIAIKLLDNSTLRVDNIVWQPKPVVIWNNQNWSNISGPTEFDDVEIHDNLNLTQNLSANNLTVLANQILTVGPNIILNIKGNLNNNGQIIFKSDATGTGVFGQFTGSISGLGNATVERYIPSRRAWRLLTAPTKGSTSNTVQDNWQGTNGEGVLLWGPSGTGLAVGPQNNIYSYNGAWTPVTNTTTTNLFDADKNNAFLVFAVGPHGGNNIASTNAAVETTLRPKGSLITGNVNYTGLTTNAFQLIANPYASPISTSALKTTNPDFNIWLLDPSLGTIGGYYTYDGNNWTPETPAGDAVNIQSGQGFFVRSASATSFTINETHKAVGNSNTWFAKPSVQTTEENKIRVLLEKQENNQWQLVDGILSVSGNNYSNAVDAQDAFKVSNFNENILFRNGTSNLAIEYQNLPTTATEQPIRLTGTTATAYRLRVKTEGFVSVNVQPILQDTQSGTNHLIPTDGSTIEIPFTGVVATTTNPDQRFKIVYQQVLGVDQPITNTLQVFPNPVTEGQFTMILPNTTEVATYEITNYLGQVIQKGGLDPSNIKISVAHQAAGVYLVKVQQRGEVYITKIVKK